MDLDFDLQLTDREPSRVLVSVLLRPIGDDPVQVDGVAVALLASDGELLSTRMLLPIAGLLHQTMVSTVELRAQGPLPPGARIAGVAWHGERQWEAKIPADPGTQLQAHCLGAVRVRPTRDAGFASALRPLGCDERAALAEALPWLRPCPPLEPRVVDDPTEDEELRRYCEGLGLDDEATDWLEDLLRE